MRKEVTHNLVIIAVLFVSIAFIFMNSSFNMTGNVVQVLDEYGNQSICENAGYTWNETFEENCTIDSDCVESCEIDCQESCEECEDIVIGGECIGDLCGNNFTDSGEECDNGDNNGLACSADYDETCTYCSSECEVINVKGEYCGDDDCNGNEDCDSCSKDCGCSSGYECVDGDCEKEKEKSESTKKSSLTSSTSKTSSSITAKATAKICDSNWTCGNWSECINGTQNRTCEDLNDCDSIENMPSISQDCVVEETCFDGIKNQNEKGIDCGGVCERRCSIFTILGSVIEGPMEQSKEFILENKTWGVIGLGSVAFLIIIVLTLKTLVKKKKLFSNKKLSDKEIAQKIGDVTHV